MRKTTPPSTPLASDGKPPMLMQRTEHTWVRSPFRSRLFGMLLLFAVVPTIVVSLVWTGAASRALSLRSTTSAWDRIGQSGERALEAVRTAPLTESQRQAVTAHEAELRQSVELAKRFEFVVSRTMRLILAGALVLVIAVAVGASRVAGHLSRQLSRPLDELVGWTRLIRNGIPLPAHSDRRGTPEFEVLRNSMRTMAQELNTGRQRALEAERAEAFRESARRFAHELKNPLTPIRFAVDRLRRSAPEELRDTVDVLAEEAARLETMARSFAQFGRLPDGPLAEIDVGELVTRVVRNTVPERLAVTVRITPALPLVRGYHEPLARAVTNVLLNAIDASPGEGVLTVTVDRATLAGDAALAIAVQDHGAGIAPEALAHVFDPYVTSKPGGTGLGLSIARQTLAAHRGEIQIISAPAAGTTVTMLLPVSGVEG